MWDLHHLAEQYGQRPSALLGISDSPWVAWDFDNAVAALVRWIEGELDKVKLTDTEKKKSNATEMLKGRRKRKLEQLLDIQKKQPVTLAELEARGVPVVRSEDHGIRPE